MEKITLENEHEFLNNQYPKFLFKGRIVKYNPEEYQMEKGEAVCFLDIKTGKVGKGFVKKVEISMPEGRAIYTIGNKTFMRHRVWPNVTDAKKIKADRKIALSKLTKRDKKVLGL